ncbi:hypothetical protein G5I_04871 [Acromyrmex echinatior]|uniref:Uncharacterized protein n=1 Tax=Acromyrmex echinatior TaxID=103372 RepID=F4WGS1_ACREC|nr:hypothetical protein G5I_04871 [Acromyrmex echinatior]
MGRIECLRTRERKAQLEHTIGEIKRPSGSQANALKNTVEITPSILSYWSKFDQGNVRREEKKNERVSEVQRYRSRGGLCTIKDMKILPELERRINCKGVRRRLRLPESKKGTSLQLNELSDCTIQLRSGRTKNTSNRGKSVKNYSKKGRKDRHNSIKCKSCIRKAAHTEGDIHRRPLPVDREQDGETQQQCQ